VTLSQKSVTSVGALRALAHPIRLDIMEALVVHGPQTASDLGTRLGQNPSNCSWHLRKLAEYGFVREQNGHYGRRRPWQAVAEGLTWGEDVPDMQSERASNALSDLMLQREIQRLRAARATAAAEPPEWRDATNGVSSLVYLTAAEATEMIDTLRQTLLEFAEARHHDSAARPEGARLVSTVAWVSPAGQLPAPKSADDGLGDVVGTLPIPIVRPENRPADQVADDAPELVTGGLDGQRNE
jgi:DNA-binding transcriptional ArsR family regulator